MLLSNNYVNGYFYPRAYEMPVLKRYELKILILRVTIVFSSHAKKHVQFFSSLEHQCSVKNSVCHIKRASNDEDCNDNEKKNEDFDVYWILTLIGIFKDSGWMSCWDVITAILFYIFF